MKIILDNMEILMSYKRYKPLVDKFFYIVFIPVLILMIFLTVISIGSIVSLILTILSDVFVFYFILSPLFGYVELRENTLFIKYGFILKKEIPYEKIRGVEKKRSFDSETMMSLKNSFEHVAVRYNTFDVTTVSVVTNDAFISELEKLISSAKGRA